MNWSLIRGVAIGLVVTAALIWVVLLAITPLGFGGWAN